MAKTNALKVVINGSQFVTKPAKEASKALTGVGTTAEKVNKIAKAAFIGVAAAASAAVASILVVVSQSRKAGDNIDKMSQKIGISRKAFQEWDYVLSQNGASVNGLQMSLKTLSNAASEARDGTAEYKDEFDRLGITVTDVNGNLKDSETLFEETFLALSDMEDQTQRTATAAKLLGRSATELAPAMNSGAEAVENLKEQATDLGLIMSDSAVDAAVKWTDSIDRIKRVFTTFKNEAVTPIMEIFSNVAETVLPAITEKLKTIQERIKQATDSGAVENISDIVSKMLLDTITFFEYLPGIINAVFTDIKDQWDDLISGTTLETRVKKFSRQVANLIISAFEIVKTALITVAKVLKTVLYNVITDFFNGIYNVFKWISEGIVNLINPILEGLATFINWFIKKDENKLKAPQLEGLGESPLKRESWSDLGKEITDAWEIATGNFVDAMAGKLDEEEMGRNKTFDTVTEEVMKLKDAMDANTAVVEKYSPTTEKARYQQSYAIDKTTIQETAGIDTKKGPYNITDMFGDIRNWFGDIGTSIGDWLEPAKEWFKNIETTVADWAKPVTAPIFTELGAISDFLEPLTNSIVSFANAFGSSIGGLISSLSSVQSVLDPISTILAGFMEVVGPAIDQVLAPIIGILKILGQTLGQILMPIIEVVGKVISKLAEGFVWLYNKAIMPFGNFLIKMYTSVGNFFIKIINGIIGLINKIPGVRIKKVKELDYESSKLKAIDMASLQDASGVAEATDYTGGTTGSSTSVQSVNITVNQYYEGPVIGDGGMASVGEFVVKAIQDYTGVGGKVEIIRA